MDHLIEKIMKRCLFSFVFVLSFFPFFRCERRSLIDKSLYPDGTIKEERHYRQKKDKESGNFDIYKYNRDGFLVESGQCRNFKEEGFFCYGNRELGWLQIYEYKNGKLNGLGKKYQQGLLTIEVVFKNDSLVIERALSKFIDSISVGILDSWGYIVNNYGPDSLIAIGQGEIVFNEDFKGILSGSQSIDASSTNYYLDNLKDTINVGRYKVFEVDLSAVKMPDGYNYLYSELILGQLKSAYELSDTSHIFYSEFNEKQIRADAKSVLGTSVGHHSVTGLLKLYALDLKKDTVKEVKTFFKQVYLINE